MKREEIKALLPEIPKEALDAIMEINGRDIEAAKAGVTAGKRRTVRFTSSGGCDTMIKKAEKGSVLPWRT